MSGPRTVVKQLMWPSGKNVWRPLIYNIGVLYPSRVTDAQDAVLAPDASTWRAGLERVLFLQLEKVAAKWSFPNIVRDEFFMCPQQFLRQPKVNKVKIFLPFSKFMKRPQTKLHADTERLQRY